MDITTEQDLKKFLDTKEMELAASLMECQVIDAGQTEVLKRLKIRVRASLPLVYSLGATHHCALTRDLSVGGAYILDSDPPPVGTRIALTVRVINPFRKDIGMIAARVVRANGISGREEAGFAVEFENLSQDNIKLLFKFVNESLGSGRS
jgi:hypothetical protein